MLHLLYSFDCKQFCAHCNFIEMHYSNNVMKKKIWFYTTLQTARLFITTCEILRERVFKSLQNFANYTARFLKIQTIYKSLLFISFFAILSNTCYARFTSLDDAAVMQSASRTTEISEDGSYTTLSTSKFKILKEQGRQFGANFHYRYNAGDTEIEIIEAKTIVNESEYNVPKESIEFKPLASAPHGFDQQMQILIAFPNVEVGAEIQLKTVTKSKALLDGYFGNYIVLNMPVQSLSNKFISKIPLHIKVNDPENVLDIKKDKSDSFNELEIFLKKPVYRNVIGVSENDGIINEEKLIVVSISSESDWGALNDRVVPHY